MATEDKRDLLELLKDELAFIEQGGYGRSVRTPWLPKSAFQDSLTCINYGYPYRAHPCNECHLLDFVAPEHRAEEIPCHFIPLNEAGATIEDLERSEDQSKLEATLKHWLQTRIGEMEGQPGSTFLTERGLKEGGRERRSNSFSQGGILTRKEK